MCPTHTRGTMGITIYIVCHRLSQSFVSALVHNLALVSALVSTQPVSETP